ncbi:MAG: hypothetical protein CHACPFDD_02866 [Phycisphaerae bacterium]|nr:hypothetical protein [Phycisphaerae bacterium]
MTCSAAPCFKLTIIGEATAQLSAALRRQHTALPWADIVAFRNIAVHAYFSIDWTIVWHTAAQDVPTLRTQVQRILDGMDAGSNQ